MAMAARTARQYCMTTFGTRRGTAGRMPLRDGGGRAGWAGYRIAPYVSGSYVGANEKLHSGTVPSATRSYPLWPHLRRTWRISRDLSLSVAHAVHPVYVAVAG